MPSHKPLPTTLELSPRARQDFIDILRHIGETWGRLRLIAEGDKINDVLWAISRNPQSGQRRDDLPATHLGYPVDPYIICYRKHSDGAQIVRILHQRISSPLHSWPELAAMARRTKQMRTLAASRTTSSGAARSPVPALQKPASA